MLKARERAAALLQKYAEKYTPEYIKEVEYELGIDEAGRGPVFGSMIYAALWWPLELKEELSTLGFNDSKVLTEELRDHLLEIIDLLRGKLVFYETKELTAEYISICMNNKKQHTNLNEISHRSALELARGALKDGFKIANIYADTVGDPGKYADYLRTNLSEFSNVIKGVVVQPKADRDHKVVSASSICAKVTRDRILKSWTFKENLSTSIFTQSLEVSWGVDTQAIQRRRSGCRITKIPSLDTQT
jgi:ribonuclease H2 subunit A